ncbi:MAG: DinB family protein [Rhodospirillaceae bacterium]|nr:DinB family protein [Rhodospirillaceae bacterium]
MEIAALRRTARFNRWANERLAASCADLSDADWTRALPGAFPNLCDTLTHIAEIDGLWMMRGGRASALPVRTGAIVSPGDFASTRRAIDAAIVGWLATLDENALSQPLVFRDTEGVERRPTLGAGLAHLFDHQSFHRGEACTMLTALGAVPPPLDMLDFFDSDPGDGKPAR